MTRMSDGVECVMVEQTKTKQRTDGPVTGERAPILHVLAPSTPMARMIRERLAREDEEAAVASETADPGESGGSPAPEA